MLSIYVCRANACLQVVEYLYEKKVDVYAPNNSECTPFYVVCLNGHEAVFDFLVDTVFKTTVMAKREPGKSSIDLMIAKDNANKCTPFYASCFNGHTNVCECAELSCFV